MAITALRDNTPGRITTMLPAYEPEKVRQYWRDAFAAIVEVLPPSAWVLQEAAFREANVLAPCKRLEVKRVNKPGPSPLSSSLVTAVPERQQRLLAAEARPLGLGGVQAVARAAGVSETTVREGVFELERGEDPLPDGRVRRRG